MKITRDQIFTIVFMLVISAIFALVLAGANAFYQPKIQENALVAERSAILYVFGLDTEGTSAEILSRFDSNVKPHSASGLDMFAQVDAQGKVLGLAVPFAGAGLWGRIEGYLGVSPDLKAIKGIVFTAQNETPGLGGRIDELAYREQFRNIAIQPGTKLAYGADGGNQLDAITGATSTSKAVLQMLNDLLENTISKMEVASNG